MNQHDPNAGIPQPGTDKDLPLRDDIRLLGRLLGDTVREQQGQAAFDLIERIRRSSIAFHRDEDQAARREFESLLEGMSMDDAMTVVRAFSYFSHLANIAEDLHHIRRSRAHLIAGSPPREGSLPHALDRAAEARVPPRELLEFFAGALLAPVLTAHPTEVQRKSVLDTEMKIADLIETRDRMRLTPEESAENSESLRRTVLALWQTRMLRKQRLAVIDEVANGLAFYDHTFLRELPRLYAGLEDELRDRGIPLTDELPSFLRMGSWIGGDRDGNPYVTAEVLGRTLRMQSMRIMAWYLEQLHQLGAEIPGASTTIEVSAELEELAARSPEPAARGRALPPYADRALREGRGNGPGTGPAARDAARGRRRSALRVGRRAGRGSRRHSSLAGRPQLGAARPGQAATTQAGGAGFRLPPGCSRPAAELRGARARGRGAAVRGTAGARVPRTG
jgi:phosphoenolpyruvate carboxylase